MSTRLMTGEGSISKFAYSKQVHLDLHLRRGLSITAGLTVADEDQV